MIEPHPEHCSRADEYHPRTNILLPLTNIQQLSYVFFLFCLGIDFSLLTHMNIIHIQGIIRNPIYSCGLLQ
jgi:hypothetical protein